MNHICSAGFDVSHSSMLKEVSAYREVNSRDFTSVHLLYLPDPSHLLSPPIDRYSKIIKMSLKGYVYIFHLHSLFSSTVNLNRGFHLLTFPTLT